MAELKKLRTTKLGTIQLSKAKNQIKGYLARGYENHESLMLSLGKSLLVFNKIESLEETCKKIRQAELPIGSLSTQPMTYLEPDKLSTDL